MPQKHGLHRWRLVADRDFHSQTVAVVTQVVEGIAAVVLWKHVEELGGGEGEK